MKKTRAGKRLATPLGRCLSNYLALVSTTILLHYKVNGLANRRITTLPTLHKHHEDRHELSWRAIGCISVILLSGCATVQPPNTVFVQVPIPCLTTNQLPIPPKLVGDAKLAALSDYDLVLQINIQRLEFEQYAKELSATLQACIK